MAVRFLIKDMNSREKMVLYFLKYLLNFTSYTIVYDTVFNMIVLIDRAYEFLSVSL